MISIDTIRILETQCQTILFIHFLSNCKQTSKRNLLIFSRWKFHSSIWFWEHHMTPKLNKACEHFLKQKSATHRSSGYHLIGNSEISCPLWKSSYQFKVHLRNWTAHGKVLLLYWTFLPCRTSHQAIWSFTTFDKLSVSFLKTLLLAVTAMKTLAVFSKNRLMTWAEAKVAKRNLM